MACLLSNKLKNVLEDFLVYISHILRHLLLFLFVLNGPCCHDPICLACNVFSSNNSSIYIIKLLFLTIYLLHTCSKEYAEYVKPIICFNNPLLIILTRKITEHLHF